MIGKWFARPRLTPHYSAQTFHGKKWLCFGIENEPIYSKWVTWWGIQRRSIRVEIVEISIFHREHGQIAKTSAVPFHDGETHIDIATCTPTWVPVWATVVCVGETVSVRNDDTRLDNVPLAPDTYSAVVVIHYPDEELEMEVWERDFVVTNNGNDSQWVDAEAKRVV